MVNDRRDEEATEAGSVRPGDWILGSVSEIVLRAAGTTLIGEMGSFHIANNFLLRIQNVTIIEGTNK